MTDWHGCVQTVGSSGTPRGGSGVQTNVFPPAHLFTVTMGRSRSMARYCVDVRPHHCALRALPATLCA